MVQRLTARSSNWISLTGLIGYAGGDVDDVGASFEGDVNGAHQVEGRKEGGAVKGHGNTEATASRSQPLHGALVLAKDDAGYVGGMMKVAFFGLVGAAVPSVLHLHQPRPVEGRVGHNNRAVHQGNANLWVAPRLLPQLENARDALDDAGHGVPEP